MASSKIIPFFKHEDTLHWMIKLSLFTIIFLCLLPGGFVRDTVNMDHFFSSHHMFEYAFLHGFHFGVDIIDNVGPYGYLHYPFTYAGGAFWSKIAWFAMICAIYAWYATQISEGIKSFPEKLFFILAIIFFPLLIECPWYAFEVLPRLAVLFSALYFLTVSDKKSRLNEVIHIIFNGIFYSFLVLEKASNVYYLVFVVVVLSAYWIMQRRWKNVLCLLGSFVSGVVLFWLAAGQSIAGLPVYFESMRSFINSYQNMFTMEMNPNALIYALIFCALIALTLLFRTTISVCITRSLKEVFRSLLIATLVFLVWKHGMGRSDLSYGTLLYTIPCVYAFLCFYPIAGLNQLEQKNRIVTLRSNRFYSLFTCGFYLIFLLVFWINMSAYEHRINCKRTIIGEFKNRFLSLVHYKPEQTLKILNEKYEVLKRTNALPSSLKNSIGRRTVDEFGSMPELIFLNDLNYSPRPTPIDFVVGNSALNEKNGQYYQQIQSAPDFVLLRDFSLRLTDTSAYLGLLLNYHVREIVQDWLVLEKNPEWTVIHIENVVKKQFSVNEWVYLNNMQQVFTWIQVDLQATKWGRLKNFLYKSDKVGLDVRLVNDVTQHFDISRSQLHSGFLINPIIKSKNPSTDQDYNNTEIPWDRVKAFRIAADAPKQQPLFQSYYNATFSIVEVGTSNANLAPLNLSKAKKQITFLRKHALLSHKKITMKSLSGPWSVYGKPANITVDKDKIVVNNEAGTSSLGVLSSTQLFLIAPDWNNITATLSEDGKELRWSNGTLWRRAT